MQQKRFSKIDILVLLLLILIITDLHSIGSFGRTTFPQDAAIVFEGAYRISEGQIPYKDFSIVMGPVIFLIQSFFNLIFGSNYLSMFIHSLLLSLLLVTIFYYLSRKYFPILISFIFSIFLYISFQGLAFHPFYNHSTYFFLFLNVFLLLHYLNKPLPKKAFFLSAVLATLDFYTKQDMGVLHIILVLCYFIFNYHKQWKNIILLYIIPTIMLVATPFYILAKYTRFEYWFNLGQAPHNPRLSNLIDPIKILEILSSWEFYIALIFIFYILFKKNNKHKPAMSLFLIISIATIVNGTLTGLTRQVSAMSIPLLIFLLALMAKEEIIRYNNKHKILTPLIIFLILLLLISPIPTYGLIATNFLSGNVKHIDQGCYKYSPMLIEDLEGLKEIRSIIESSNNSFISITQYSFLYCDYNQEPPKNLPAWFDQGNSFYKINFPDMKQTILDYNPKIILIQEAHHHQDPEFHQFIINTFLEEDYKIHKIINQEATQKPITILIKN